MILFADEDVPAPVLRALQEVKFDIQSVADLPLSTRDDRAVMQVVLEQGGILVTRDTGIPSQAYLHQFAQGGLTVVVLRWKTSFPRDWQQMVEVILRDAEKWRETAAREPSVISVSHRGGSRPRAWSQIPPDIVGA